jgi:hypothetical protein
MNRRSGRIPTSFEAQFLRFTTQPSNFGFELAKGSFDCALSMTIIRSAEPRKSELFQLVHLCRCFLQGVLQCALEDQNLHLVLRVRAMR